VGSENSTGFFQMTYNSGKGREKKKRKEVVKKGAEKEEGSGGNVSKAV